jgi:ATP-dependent DNA helicase UvrD/PcrA
LDPLLKDATKAQAEAITHLEGPLLVLAGPGSGKTRVVTRRIAWLVEQGVPPEHILAITFTNKAAEEMRDRVNQLLCAPGIWVSTFHSMGARMLRSSADRIGMDRSFTIYDDQDQVRVIRDIMKGLDLDTTQFKPPAVASRISRLKSDLITPGQAARRAHDFFTEAVARIYPIYERRLLESNGMDFDDLLVKNLKLLTESEDARNYYQNRFQFVLVDEYQDTNRVQFLLLKTLAEPQQNIHVTGDPDQSIYRFRGADIRNILDFEKVYPKARTIRLEENFRSTASILTGADSLIKHNRERKEKRLVGTLGEGRKIRIHEAEDEEAEGRYVADEVRKAFSRGIPYSEIAIFYRIHALSRSLERAFMDQGIPYVIVRGTEFYRRAEVQDLLAYLKVVANPRDSENLLRILNVPARGIGLTTRDRLLAHARERGTTLLKTIFDADGTPGVKGRSLSSIKSLAGIFRTLAALSEGPVADLLTELVGRTDFAAHLKAKHPDNHEDRLENVSQLVSSAAEFEEKHPGAGLSAYLEEVSLVSDVDRFDPDAARVAFMTLHTAKGLEFRSVFVTGMEEGLLPHSRSRESRQELEEERRLLFVGMTRAREELNLTHAQRRFRWGEHSFARPSSFYEEIDVEAVEADMPPAPEKSLFKTEPWVEPKSGDGIVLGATVRHSHFGLGRVLDLSGSGPSTRVTVDFRDHGRKKLVLMYAKLVAAEEGSW